jgi:tetratricopeptide (TPR) repeat protein
LWENKEVKSEIVIEEINRFVEIFSTSKKSSKLNLLLADLYIRNGDDKEALFVIDRLIDKEAIEYIDEISSFLQSRFDKINNRSYLAKLFKKCYLKSNNKKHKELEHYTLFVEAQKLERENNLELAKSIYKSIATDEVKTKYLQLAIYNMAIIENKVGDKKKALEIMRDVSEGELRTKALEFMYSVGLESMNFEFAGESAEKIAIRDNNNEMFLNAIELYIKAKKFDDAKRVIDLVKQRGLKNEWEERILIYEAMYFYHANEINKAKNIFIKLLKNKRFEYFTFENIIMLSELTKKFIFTLSDDEAREYLESFIELCGYNYKKTGYIGYTYTLGSLLIDYSVFFINKEEAVKKGLEILREALKQSIENEDIDITQKVASKIKENDSNIREKRFVLPPFSIEKEIIDLIKELK